MGTVLKRERFCQNLAADNLFNIFLSWGCYFLKALLNQLYLIRCQIAYVCSNARLIYENHIAGSDTQLLHQSHQRKATARNNKMTFGGSEKKLDLDSFFIHFVLHKIYFICK